MIFDGFAPEAPVRTRPKPHFQYVLDSIGAEDRDAIPRGMQLVVGKTGQEYNMRKHREGAF